MSTREISAGAHSRPLASHTRPNTLADSFAAICAAFEPLKIFKPLLDVLAIAVAVVTGLTGAAALVVGIAMAFVRQVLGARAS